MDGSNLLAWLPFFFHVEQTHKLITHFNTVGFAGEPKADMLKKLERVGVKLLHTQARFAHPHRFA